MQDMDGRDKLQQLADLTPEDQKKAEKLAFELEGARGTEVAHFGMSVQARISENADSILKYMHAMEIVPAESILNKFLEKIENLSGEGEKTLLDYVPFLRGAESEDERFLARYERANDEFNLITAELDGARIELLKNSKQLEYLRVSPEELIKELDLYICAGMLALEKGGVENKLSEIELERFRTALEKKLHGLKISRVVALQSLPRITLLAKSHEELAETLRTILAVAVPLWKEQIKITLELFEQKKDAKNQAAASRDNAEELREKEKVLRQKALRLGIEIKDETFAPEAFKEVNAALLGAIKTGLRIQAENRQRREAAARESRSDARF